MTLARLYFSATHSVVVPAYYYPLALAALYYGEESLLDERYNIHPRVWEKGE